jgi:5'-3' exonuclease
MNIAILDSHNHLHRFHHVLEKVSPNGSLCPMWGKMVASLIRELKLHKAFAVFDPLHKEAKANRQPTPERIVREHPDIEAQCKAIGIKVVKPYENEEGDQLIADLWANIPITEETNLYIITSDKDMAQLVGTTSRNGCDVHTYVVRPNNGDWTVLGRSQVKEKWGVWPEQIADYLILMGDDTDGIKGIKGIGKKTAASLLSVYGSIDNLLNKSFTYGEGVRPVTGLSQRLALNLEENLPEIPIKRLMIELHPRDLNLTEEWCHQPVSVPIATRLLGPIGLSDMLAKVMGGRLWSKI